MNASTSDSASSISTASPGKLRAELIGGRLPRDVPADLVMPMLREAVNSTQAA
jgi:hypothetical protein